MGVPREQRLVPLSLVSDANGARRETAVWRALFFRSAKLAGGRYISMRTAKVTLSRHTHTHTHLSICAHNRTHKLRPASQPDRQTRTARTGRPAGRQHARPAENGSTFCGTHFLTAPQASRLHGSERYWRNRRRACACVIYVRVFFCAQQKRGKSARPNGGERHPHAQSAIESNLYTFASFADDRILRPEVAARGSLLFSTASARIGS